jgi:hypothetical protein
MGHVKMAIQAIESIGEKSFKVLFYDEFNPIQFQAGDMKMAVCQVRPK